MSTPLLDRAAALPRETVPPLVDLVTALADNKHALGLRYGEWCSSGPTIEAGVAATAMAQDELGHARVLYGLLEELPGAPRRSEHEWAAGDARTVAFVDRPFPSWSHLIVANLLVDQALTLVLETALGSRYLPLRQRTRKLIEEEQFHAVHGQGWLLQPLVAGGVLREAGEGVRRRFLRQIGPLLRDAGLASLLRADGDGWVPAEALPWAEWDESRRRMRRG